MLRPAPSAPVPTGLFVSTLSGLVPALRAAQAAADAKGSRTPVPALTSHLFTANF